MSLFGCPIPPRVAREWWRLGTNAATPLFAESSPHYMQIDTENGNSRGLEVEETRLNRLPWARQASKSDRNTPLIEVDDAAKLAVDQRFPQDPRSMIVESSRLHDIQYF
jgi:hypothetical protein